MVALPPIAVVLLGMPLKVLVTVFIAAVTWRTWLRWRRREMRGREAWLWTLLWALVLAASWRPQATDVVARWFGIGRGADLLIFLSVVALFALVSWLLSRVGKIEREITALVREMALRDSKEAGDSEQGAGDKSTTIPNS